MAQTFTGAPTMQAILDEAVDHYLSWMKANADGFSEAIRNAVAFQERQSGIRHIRPTDGSQG